MIEDELEGERNHRYDLRWHLPPGPAEERADGVLTPDVEIVIRGARSVALEDGLGQPRVRRQARGAGRERGRRRPHRALRHLPRAAGMTLLAADPRVPRRDALLRPETMAGVLSQRLHAGVPVDACERMYVKYRVGDSVRVVYRYRVGEQTTFAAARSGRSDGVPAPEVDAALYPFPHDRKLEALPRLPGRLVAWAAEQSATARSCDGAYAKVQRGDGERRGLRALADQDAVRVPRILADARRRPHDRGPPRPHARTCTQFGKTLRALHNLKGTVPLDRPQPGPTRGDHPPTGVRDWRT